MPAAKNGLAPNRSSNLLVAVAALLAGCSGEQPGQRAGADPAAKPFPEFVAAAERIEKSANQYLGRNQVTQLEALLRMPGKSGAERVKIHTQLCREHLRLGDIDAAMEQLELAKGLLAPGSAGAGRDPRRRRRSSTCGRRRSPTASPITGRSAASFRSPADGIHKTVSGPAVGSEANLARDSCRATPLTGVPSGLLNIASMAIGDYPDGRAGGVPGSAFGFRTHGRTSVGSEDVAPALGLDLFDLCGGVIVEDFDNGRPTSTLSPPAPTRGSR